MKWTLFIFCTFLLMSCAKGREMVFIGSTPSHPVIESFFNIPPDDSIDFVRWRISFNKNSYSVKINYGIGKPNTSGFVNNGKKAEANGLFTRVENTIILQSGSDSILLQELNPAILVFVDRNNLPLVGNAGWSFILNNENAVIGKVKSVNLPYPVLKDSMAFAGRTPCHYFSFADPGCIKLKWDVTLYADKQRQQTGRFKIRLTTFRNDGYQYGDWKIIQPSNGSLIYQLSFNNKTIHLLKLSDDVLIFTDDKGNLMQGDENFSYVLNRYN